MHIFWKWCFLLPELLTACLRYAKDCSAEIPELSLCKLPHCWTQHSHNHTHHSSISSGDASSESLRQGGMKPSLDGREEETVHLHNFCITQSGTRVDIGNANGAKKDGSASPLRTRGNLFSAVLVGSRLPLYIIFLFPAPEHKPWQCQEGEFLLVSSTLYQEILILTGTANKN